MAKLQRKQIKKSYCVRFSADNTLLVSCGRDVVMWECPEIRKLWRTHPISHPCHLAFSPGGTKLAVKNTAGEMVILATTSGEILYNFHCKRDGEGSNLHFTSDGLHLVHGSSEGSHIVRVVLGLVTFREEFYPDMVMSVHRLPNNVYWFHHWRRHFGEYDVEHKDRLIGRTWPFVAGSYEIVELPFETCSGIAFSSDGKMLAILTRGVPPLITLHSFPGVQQLSSFVPQEDRKWVTSIRFSPAGDILVATGDALTLLTVPDLNVDLSFAMPYSCDVDFTGDGATLAVGSWSAGEVFRLDQIHSRG